MKRYIPWRKATPVMVAAGLVLAGAAGAEKPIKLATLAPDGSAWHKVVEEMGNELKRDTSGRVSLRVYAGGVAGDDRDMVRKIRIGQLQAGALTVGGLSSIDTAFNVFSIPLFFDSYEEFYHVREQLTPLLGQRLDEAGFVLLHWGDAGWVHIFSKEPMRTVDDLKKSRIFTWAGDDRMAEMWKENGFQPVALASTDILMGLQTGMIDLLPTTPYFALAMQFFRVTPYMLDLGLAPLVGGTVISKKVWEKLSEADRDVVMAAARRADEKLARIIPEKDVESVKEMTARGLTVIDVDTAGDPAWRETAAAFASAMRTRLVPAEIYDLALKYRDEHRASGARSTEKPGS